MNPRGITPEAGQLFGNSRLAGRKNPKLSLDFSPFRLTWLGNPGDPFISKQIVVKNFKKGEGNSAFGLKKYFKVLVISAIGDLVGV